MLKCLMQFWSSSKCLLFYRCLYFYLKTRQIVCFCFFVLFVILSGLYYFKESYLTNLFKTMWYVFPCLSSALLLFTISCFILISALKRLSFQHGSANWLGAVRVYWSSWSNLCPLSFSNPLPLASTPHSAGYHWLQSDLQWRQVPCITPHYVSVSPALKQLHSLNLIQGAVICIPLARR